MNDSPVTKRVRKLHLKIPVNFKALQNKQKKLFMHFPRERIDDKTLKVWNFVKIRAFDEK